MDDWEENEDLLAEGVAIGERMGYAEGVVLGAVKANQIGAELSYMRVITRYIQAKFSAISPESVILGVENSVSEKVRLDVETSGAGGSVPAIIDAVGKASATKVLSDAIVRSSTSGSPCESAQCCGSADTMKRNDCGGECDCASPREGTAATSARTKTPVSSVLPAESDVRIDGTRISDVPARSGEGTVSGNDRIVGLCDTILLAIENFPRHNDRDVDLVNAFGSINAKFKLLLARAKYQQLSYSAMQMNDAAHNSRNNINISNNNTTSGVVAGDLSF